MTCGDARDMFSLLADDALTPLERAALELPHAFGRQPDQLRHLEQRERLAAADAEAKLNYPARVRVQSLERAADRFLL